MTIATKNGVPIVKDGVIASNCGCCGGWYCCDDRLFNSQCRVTSLGSLVGVSVTIDAQDYKKVVAFSNAKCFGQFGILQPHVIGRQAVGITLGSRLSGTFNLTPQFNAGSSNNNRAAWLYTHTIATTDAVGCTGYDIRVDVISECVLIGGVYSTRLRISQAYGAYRAYQWSKTKAGAPPNDSVTTSDMVCSGSSSGVFPCPDASGVRIVKIGLSSLPFPLQIEGQLYDEILIPGPCRPLQETWSRQYQAMLFDHPFPASGDEKGPVEDRTVVSEEGSPLFTATTTVTLL